MGRPPKPTQLHVVDGTYNVTRHADRSFVPSSGGEPERPDGLDDYGRECWDKFVTPVVSARVAEAFDTIGVAEACRLYSFYRRSCDAAALDPVDKNARCAVVGYWSAFERVAAKYGLTPADRIRLVPQKPEGSSDPAEAHFRNSA